jgi:hypothetical protein
MGFTVSYRSTRPVTSTEKAAIQLAARDAIQGRTWLGCEPVHFVSDEDGYLLGFSKPNFVPHPDDVAAAEQEKLPNGTTRDMIDILCQLSRDHAIDWEISHDFSDGPIGHIKSGTCDEEVLAQIEIFSELPDILGEFGID